MAANGHELLFRCIQPYRPLQPNAHFKTAKSRNFRLIQRPSRANTRRKSPLIDCCQHTPLLAHSDNAMDYRASAYPTPDSNTAVIFKNGRNNPEETAPEFLSIIHKPFRQDQEQLYPVMAQGVILNPEGTNAQMGVFGLYGLDFLVL